MTISLKTKTVFHCKCVRCHHEWDSDKKPLRCSHCKYRSWNGEDHRFVDPWNGVPIPSQIKTGTEAPRPPKHEPMLDALIKARAVIAELVTENPCNHKKHMCVCAEIELVGEIDQQIEKLRTLQPRRSTYLVNKAEEVAQ